MSLDAIKARLGSISPTKLAALPPSVRVLLKTDLPCLLEAVGALKVIAAQGSGKALSISKADCMAALAQTAMDHLEGL